MPNSTAQSPQSQSQANQNYSPDIQAMYADFVTGGATPGNSNAGANVGIDDLRAQLNTSVTGQTTANLIASLNINPTSTTAASTPNTSTPTILSQESRAHAFYRIIGFPVVSSDMTTFYNPGFDIVLQNTPRNVPLSKKITIASNVGTAFETLSQTREQYVASISQVFSNPMSVEAGVLALMSGTYGKSGNPNKRLFSSPFTKISGPFDTNVADQAYSSSIQSMFSLVGNQEVSLALYQDANGNFPNISVTNPSVLTQHQHIIIPFAVDPRIDFSIWSTPSATSDNVSKRVAVPFVPDASFLKTSATTTAQRPLIEKVITERFSQFNDVSTTGVANQDVINYIQSVKLTASPAYGGVTLSQIASGGIFGLSQQAAFANYLSIMQAMMKALVDAMRIIHSAQGAYYWLPQPSPQGPENAGSVRDVPLNANLPMTLITNPGDLNIILNQAQVVLSSINSSIAQSNAVPDPGGYSFSGFFNQKLTFDDTTSNSQGNLSSNTSDTLASKRTKKLTDAIQALQTVEMIMGEFSGLGLADIISIVGSLYVIPQVNLLGFLDDDAIVRAETVLGLSSGSLQGQRPPLQTAMESFGSTVNLFYLVMDQIFQDYLTAGALNIT